MAGVARGASETLHGCISAWALDDSITASVCGHGGAWRLTEGACGWLGRRGELDDRLEWRERQGLLPGQVVALSAELQPLRALPLQ